MEAERPVEASVAALEQYVAFQKDSVITPVLRLLRADFVEPEQHMEEISWIMELTKPVLDIYRYRRLRKKLADKVGIEAHLAELYLQSIRHTRMSRRR